MSVEPIVRDQGVFHVGVEVHGVEYSYAPTCVDVRGA